MRHVAAWMLGVPISVIAISLAVWLGSSTGRVLALADPMTGRITTSVVVLTLVGASAGCASLRTHKSSHKEFLTPDQRTAAIRRAQVWHPTRVAAMNLRTGPGGKGAFAPGETVTCDYVDDKLGGTSPKFACAVTPDDVVKVKYGRDNGEVYAGVAATRLLWALGFGADAMYPVHVICRGCPSALADRDQVPSNPPRFEVAAIERKMSGHDMETKDGPGWAWSELDHVDPAVGGAPLAQRDALKLLGVLIQHTDSKMEQQRLLCEDEKGHKHDLARCKAPFMMVHDVGETFGTGSQFNRQAVSSVNLAEWINTPVWKDAKRCIGNLTESQTGTLVNPPISEAGRRFLADHLNLLTDRQLHDLFEVSQFTTRPQADGKPTTIEAWVDAFRQKRHDITSVSCPS